MHIKVGVVDNYPTLVLGLATLVNAQTDMTFSANSRTVQGLLASGKEIDVAVLDPNLDDTLTPAMRVGALIARGIGVVLFTGPQAPRLHIEPDRVRTARKTDPLPTLLDQIRAGHGEKSVLTAQRPRPRRSDFVVQTPRLTRREREVLELYSMGDTANHVATLLGIGRNTVVDHIKRIRKKYAAVGRPAPNKVDLFRRAVEDGMIFSTPHEPRQASGRV